MYNFNKPLKWHIELTDKCNAVCPQCPRNYIDKDGNLKTFSHLNSSELYLEDFKNIFDKKFWNKFEVSKFLFCGNLSDPIAARDLHEIINYCYCNTNQFKTETKNAMNISY